DAPDNGRRRVLLWPPQPDSSSIDDSVGLLREWDRFYRFKALKDLRARRHYRKSADGRQRDDRVAPGSRRWWHPRSSSPAVGGERVGQAGGRDSSTVRAFRECSSCFGMGHLSRWRTGVRSATGVGEYVPSAVPPSAPPAARAPSVARAGWPARPGAAAAAPCWAPR